MRHQGLYGGVGVFDQMQQGAANFIDVMGRNGGRHADRDALRAIGQQIGEIGRQNHRLFLAPVVGRPKIDGVFVNAGQQALGDGGHTRLGIAHGGGVIAIDIAKITLAVDQRVALGEILRQAHHGVVNGGVAMGVIFAHDIADDTRRFLEPLARTQAQLTHRVEQAAMDRFQPIAHIRQRARGDGR